MVADLEILWRHSLKINKCHHLKLIKTSENCHCKFTSHYSNFLSSNILKEKCNKFYTHHFKDMSSMLRREQSERYNCVCTFFFVKYLQVCVFTSNPFHKLLKFFTVSITMEKDVCKIWRDGSENILILPYLDMSSTNCDMM